MANYGQIPHEYFKVTIPSGETISNYASLHGYTILGFDFPVSYEGATTTFLSATTPTGEYKSVRDYSQSATAVTVYSAANTHVPVPPTLLASCQNIKVVSATATAEDRIVTIIARPVV